MRNARNILLIILFVLVATAVFVVYAEKILAYGATQINPLLEARLETERLAEDVKEAGERISRLEQEVNWEVLSMDREGDDRSSARVAIVRAQVKRAEVEHDEAVEQLSKSRTLLQSLIGMAAGSSDSPEAGGVTASFSALTERQFFTAALLVRFGVLGVAVYLVQILINLYRYNTQVAAHYWTQRDAIVTSEWNGKKLKDAYELYIPKVEYGRTPKWALQEISDSVSSRLRGKDVAQ